MNECSCQNSRQNTSRSMDMLGQFPIAMAYVPWQQFRQTYDLDKALCSGTIFCELNKPFCGKRGACK